MGINGLWTLVNGTQTIKTLAELVEESGYCYENRNSCVLRVGVDMSVLVNKCIAVVQSKHLYSQNQGGPLLTIFQKLCKFLKHPIIFVFVFDGPERPSIKRGKTINTRRVPWWTRPCVNMLDAMGFNMHQAPGEAEAELAHLSKACHIDAILTKDGDALAFGARCVLRSIPDTNGQYGVYTSDGIREAIGCGRGGFLLLALMSGGDYSDGVEDCGKSAVTGLIKCGFGESLLEILNTLESANLEHALAEWLTAVKCELVTNSRKFLSSRQPGLAGRLTLDFLDPTVRKLYMRPITSSMASDTSYDFTEWIHREPDVPEIIDLCMKHFGWETGESLGKHLQNTLLEGIFIQALCSNYATHNDLTREIITGNNAYGFSGGFLRIEINECSYKSRKNHPGNWARISFVSTSAQELMSRAGEEPEAHSDNFFLKVWVRVSHLPPGICSWLAAKNPDNTNDNTSKNKRVSDSEYLDEPFKQPRFLDFLDQQIEQRCNSPTSGQKRKHEASFPEIDINLTLEEDSVPSTSYRRRVPAPFPMNVIDLTHSSNAVEDSEVIYISD